MFTGWPGVKRTKVFFILPLKFFTVDSEKASNGITIGGAVIY